MVDTQQSIRKRLLPLARGGDPESQYELGCVYDFDPPKDRRRAFRWYLCAAEQGHSEAQNLLAEMYREGIATPVNRRRAMEWFRRAAEQGNSDAQVSLGYALFYGEGAEQDRREALKWYRRAARREEERAWYNLAQMYRTGDVVAQSWPRAIEWFRRAAMKGHVDSLHWLARIYGGEVGASEKHQGGPQVAPSRRRGRRHNVPVQSGRSLSHG